MLVEELASHQDEARRAETALEGAALDERLLHGIQFLVVFDRNDFPALRQAGQIEASGARRAVDEQGAAAAQALPAALARAMQAECIAQHFDQGFVRRDLRLDAFPVQLEANRLSHFFCIAMKTASGFIGSSVSRTPTASWIALA